MFDAPTQELYRQGVHCTEGLILLTVRRHRFPEPPRVFTLLDLWNRNVLLNDYTYLASRPSLW